jgi:uncharacterized protein (TIGR02147 family)
LKKPGLKEIVKKDVKPSSYLDYRLFFRALYEHRKEAGEYSYQKYAEDLGFKATTVMHQIVHGYRPLTDKAAVSVIEKLDLESAEAQYLSALVSFCNSKTSVKREEYFQKLQTLKKKTLPDELDKDMLEYFSVWYNPVIWELIGTQGFQPDVNWIAKRIIPNLKPAQVKTSLELLERLNLIMFDPELQTYRQTKDRVSTGHRIKGMALVSYHSSMIDHAKAALTSISGQRRDVSAVTVSVNEETAKKLRAMIHTFQLQLLDEADRGGVGDEIYQINIQLFPFTE